MELTIVSCVIGCAGILSIGSLGSQMNNQCPSDLDGDSHVTAQDLSILLGQWGATSEPQSADINLDGVVSAEDLAALLAAWGSCYLAITSVNPAGGPEVGGTAITISGARFTGASSVTIGGAEASNVVVNSATSISAVTPPGTMANSDVVVTTPIGSVTAVGAYEYSPVGAWAAVLEWEVDQAVVTDSAFRKRMVALSLPWRVRERRTGMEMVLVPPGTFMMGASPGDSEAFSSEFPVHQVTLTQPFYFGRTEVTQAVWLAIMGSNPSFFFNSPSKPVEQVSWNMAQQFCAQTGLRLPTEAEWEYAARGGNASPRYGPLDDIAWWLSNSGNKTNAVGGKLPNPLGLYDTIGNVSEHVEDWWSYYQPGSVTDPLAPPKNPWFGRRMNRGGCWFSAAAGNRVSIRWMQTPELANLHIGFRLARTP